MCVIAGIIGLILYFVQNGWASDSQFEIIYAAESNTNDPTEGTEQVPQNLLNVQRKIIADLVKFRVNPDFSPNNIYDALAKLHMLNELTPAEICTYLDGLENYVRELRNIQAGR